MKPSLPIPYPLRSHFSRLLPDLSFHLHKGECGKLCIVGGSKNYTGAPFFAAMTPLKLGADLSTVLCSSDAEIPLKTYSPELMVRGLLVPEWRFQERLTQQSNNEIITNHNQPPSPSASDYSLLTHSISSELSDFLSRSHCVVFGPGLGREPAIFRQVEFIINEAKKRDLPLVLDGDALSLLAEKPELLVGYKKAILTPNAMEFRRLWLSAHKGNLKENGGEIETPPMNLSVNDDLMALLMNGTSIEGEGGFLSVSDPLAVHTAQLARAFGGLTVLRKGPIDVASDGESALYCCRLGAPRRCGGQGDVLAGSVGTFFAWSEAATKDKRIELQTLHSPAAQSAAPIHFTPTTGLLAAYFGSLITRRAAELSFSLHGRSMLASHLVEQCETLMEEWFPIKTKLHRL